MSLARIGDHRSSFAEVGEWPAGVSWLVGSTCQLTPAIRQGIFGDIFIRGLS
jgi:hypothetical protein